MKVNIHGKGIKVGDQLQQRIEEKLSKFNRFSGMMLLPMSRSGPMVISKSLR